MGLGFRVLSFGLCQPQCGQDFHARGDAQMHMSPMAAI